MPTLFREGPSVRRSPHGTHPTETTRPVLGYLSLFCIPLVAAVIGWVTNRIAVWMTFNPLEFRGHPPYLGWQGIIPRNSNKIAQKTVDLVTSRLVPADEVLARVDPARLAAALEPVYGRLSFEIVDEVIRAQNPAIWSLLPRIVRRQLHDQVKRQIPALIERMHAEYRENFEALFDLRGLVLENLTGPNKRRLNELFMRCGHVEFEFIVRCGFYIGLGLGCVQAAVWWLVPTWWTLPLAGVLVGYLTNWLAIQMIFRPIEEVRFLSFRYRGLFLKRQDEVSREYAQLLANEIIIPSKIVEMLAQGERADLFVETVHTQLEALLDDRLGRLQGAVLLTVGSAPYARLKRRVTRKIVELIPRHSHLMESYWRDAMDLETTMGERLRSLPPAEFESVLRTCFKEDEWILITVGAVLGMVAGLLEALVLVF